MDSWRRFWRLSRQEKSCFLQAVVWLPLTTLAVRWLGFRRWQKFLETFPRSRSSDSSSAPALILPIAQPAARMVAAAARRSPFRPNCLHRSLVLWWFLRRRGLNPELRFGGRKEDKQLEAHAWVEVGGLVLDVSDTSPQNFALFERPVVREPR